MIVCIVPGRRSRVDALVIAGNAMVAGSMAMLAGMLAVFLTDRDAPKTADWVLLAIACFMALGCGGQLAHDLYKFEDGGGSEQSFGGDDDDDHA